MIQILSEWDAMSVLAPRTERTDFGVDDLLARAVPAAIRIAMAFAFLIATDHADFQRSALDVILLVTDFGDPILHALHEDLFLCDLFSPDGHLIASCKSLSISSAMMLGISGAIRSRIGWMNGLGSISLVPNSR